MIKIAGGFVAPVQGLPVHGVKVVKGCPNDRVNFDIIVGVIVHRPFVRVSISDVMLTFRINGVVYDIVYVIHVAQIFN